MPFQHVDGPLQDAAILQLDGEALGGQWNRIVEIRYQADLHAPGQCPDLRVRDPLLREVIEDDLASNESDGDAIGCAGDRFDDRVPFRIVPRLSRKAEGVRHKEGFDICDLFDLEVVLLCQRQR